MKKNNKIKKSVSMLAFLFVCALSVILSSCSDELDIQQSYPFKVETMPVPKDIVRGQTVEIYFATRFGGFLVQEVSRDSNQQGILYFVDKET